MDLERSDVIDLLPDRDAKTVAAWLKTHPGDEVVGRDRSQTTPRRQRRVPPKSSRLRIDGT